jgi:hypothetical protein
MLDSFPAMPQDYNKEIADSAEPPTIFIPSCGVLCDIFWWARRQPGPSTIPPPDEPQTR